MQEQQRTGVGAIMGALVTTIVFVAIVWFFFLGGTISTTDIYTGSDVTNRSQILHQVHDNPPVDPR